MSKWYLAIFEGDEENEYERFDTDAEAINNFVFGNTPRVLEIHECDNDECLTPVRMVYPEGGTP